MVLLVAIGRSDTTKIKVILEVRRLRIVDVMTSPVVIIILAVVNLRGSTGAVEILGNIVGGAIRKVNLVVVTRVLQVVTLGLVVLVTSVTM